MRIFRRRLAVAKQRLDQIILERLSSEEAALIESTERRLYDEGVGLFWVTVIGLGLILGGIVAMKALQLSKVLIIGYMILGSTAFTLNIGLSLWQIRRLARIQQQPELKRSVTRRTSLIGSGAGLSLITFIL